jgi:Cyanophycin synthase-like N-terminal domain
VPVIAIDRVDVADGRLEAVVRVADETHLRTSSRPSLGPRLLAILPGLARHRCDNVDGLTFTEELADTETPHLLEHVAEELMALAGSPRWLKGQTSWDFGRDGRGVFRVVLAYDDDLVALGAVKEAAALVDWLFMGSPEPDVDAAVARLRGLRRL